MDGITPCNVAWSSESNMAFAPALGQVDTMRLPVHPDQSSCEALVKCLGYMVDELRVSMYVARSPPALSPYGLSSFHQSRLGRMTIAAAGPTMAA